MADDVIATLRAPGYLPSGCHCGFKSILYVGVSELMIHIPLQGQGARKFSYALPSHYEALRELALYFHRHKYFLSHYFSYPFILQTPYYTTTKLLGEKLAFNWRLICVFIHLGIKKEQNL